MLSFAILLFFAVTGLTLNHAEWFESRQRPTVYHGTLDKSWVNTSDPGAVAKDELVNYFRRTYRTKGSLSDFHVDGDQCEVLFKGPGYEADATIDRQTGTYDLTVSPFSLVAVLNDLHKGRDAGKKWSAVIDFSAVLMTLVSLDRTHADFLPQQAPIFRASPGSSWSGDLLPNLFSLDILIKKALRYFLRSRQDCQTYIDLVGSNRGACKLVVSSAVEAYDAWAKNP